jgi:hypothetical protein
MGKPGPQPVDQHGLELWYGAWLGVFDGMRTGRYMRKDLDFKPETELWLQLLQAETPKQVRDVCTKSDFWLNPKRGGTAFNRLLSEKAGQFLAAKKDPRWPQSDRPTNEGKRIRFLARALAGITMGISIRTAQDLLAKLDKEKLEKIYYPVCDCGHRERDHRTRTNCKYCSCDQYRFSGGECGEALRTEHLLGDARPSQRSQT